LGVLEADLAREASPRRGFAQPDERLELPRGDRHGGVRFLALPTDPYVVILDRVERRLRQRGPDRASRERDVFLEQVRREGRPAGTRELGELPRMLDLASRGEDLVREVSVPDLVGDVADREDDIEPGEEGGRKVDLLGDRPVVREPTPL